MKKKITTLKKKLDNIFSRYIRLRDAIKIEGDETKGKCITCGKIGYIKEMHCGHYVPRNVLATRYDEDNCHLQCPSCNLWKNKGVMMIEYREKLVQKIGEDKVKELESKRWNITKLDAKWYEDKIQHYKEQVQKMGDIWS